MTYKVILSVNLPCSTAWIMADFLKETNFIIGKYKKESKAQFARV